MSAEQILHQERSWLDLSGGVFDVLGRVLLSRVAEPGRER